MSLHTNAHSDVAISGTEAYYNPKHLKHVNSLDYAQILLEHQLKNFSKSRVKENSGLYLLRNTLVAGVYLQLGFLTNASDRLILEDKDKQVKIAASIYDGLLAIRNSK